MIQFKNEYITVFQSALYQTTSSVVEANEFVLVVDPNWLPHEVEEIKQHVAKVRENKELYLLFTHGDFDHVMGYNAFPGAKIIGSIGLREHPAKQQTVEKIKKFYNDYYIKEPYPIEFPEVDIVVKEDGQKLVVGESTITFYLSPGHTQDGIFTIIEPYGVWIAGDYLSDFELPFIEDSAKAYEDTLVKAEQILEEHKISLLVPGHGQSTSSIEGIKHRIQVGRDYLKRLRAAVLENNLDALELLEKEMAYPSNFTKLCHEGNVEMMKKEYVYFKK